MSKPAVLIIRDGWGENHNTDQDAYNAIKLANTPVADKIRTEYPRTEIEAAGLAVGLPEGVMGNSEVGHQNIGAGRVVNQEIVRLNKGFEEGDFKQNPVIQKAFEKAINGGKLHLFGIVSDAGVHGLLEHLYGLVQLAKDAGLQQVYLHAFTDGRDTPPQSGLRYIKEVEAQFKKIGLGKIATVSGRYWAMDRDLRWDRIQKVYDSLTGKTVIRTANSAEEAIQEYYENPVQGMKGDEFIPSTQIQENGNAIATVEDGDAVIFYNFRGDRPRELTRAFIEDGFDGFDRGKKIDLYYAIMTNYQKGLCPNIVLDKPAKMEGILAQIVSDAGIGQFRCAETEKFPHVTFFFNDYREEPFPLEDRKIIPSPKDVATYDLKPEMSAEAVCSATKEAILSGKYGLIVVNFANPDMVGHTGNKEAIIKAVEIVDAHVGTLLNTIKEVGGSAIVTADHGNCDLMYDTSINSPHTSHTLNPVEVVLVSEEHKGKKLLEGGKLENIAPTLLQLIGLEQPTAMTGKSLIL